MNNLHCKFVKCPLTHQGAKNAVDTFERKMTFKKCGDGPVTERHDQVTCKYIYIILNTGYISISHNSISNRCYNISL